MRTLLPALRPFVRLFALPLALTVGGLHAAEPAAPAPAASAGTAKLTAAELEAGWVRLFDGETLFGWEASSEADWTVKDGTIAVSSGKQGLLCTTAPFLDYELHVEFKAPKDTNSGVFLRTPLQPKDPAVDCLELNVAPASNPFPTGSFVKRQKAAAVAESAEWQAFDVTLEGNKCLVKLDGKTVLEYSDPNPTKGRIGLQFREGAIAFRNIKLRPLGLKSLFNGKDLTGWKVFEGPGMASVYSVTPDGLLNVKNGRGSLESEAQFKDFVLQMEVFCNGTHLNSGLFFRSIPGEFTNGYESQIHNGFKDGDRTKPLDFGTGGIYRRQPARKVAADDGVWFRKTLVAEGPHFCVWVEGELVTAWTDPRKPDPNPRKGLRLEGGTLSLQGHDPTTDISFRNLRAREQ